MNIYADQLEKKAFEDLAIIDHLHAAYWIPPVQNMKELVGITPTDHLAYADGSDLAVYVMSIGDTVFYQDGKWKRLTAPFITDPVSLLELRVNELEMKFKELENKCSQS